MVKRYHGSFPSFSYGFDSRYPLQKTSPMVSEDGECAAYLITASAFELEDRFIGLRNGLDER